MAVQTVPTAGVPPVDADAVVPVAAVPPAAIVGAVEPVVVTAPVVETPPAAPPVETPPATPPAEATVADTPSLLEAAVAPGEETPPAVVEEAPKPVDAPKPADAAAPAEAPKPADTPPAELPKVDYKFEVPADSGITMNDESRGRFTAAVDAVRKDPSNLQPLMDLHVQTIKDFVAQHQQAALANQHKVFNDTRKDWQKQVKDDPVMGGNGIDTTTKTVARVRDQLVSNAPRGSKRWQADVKAASEFFRVTGAGDHPVMWRILHNASAFIDEAQNGPPPEGGAPQGNGRPPGGSRRALIYDHPSSKKT